MLYKEPNICIWLNYFIIIIIMIIIIIIIMKQQKKLISKYDVFSKVHKI